MNQDDLTDDFGEIGADVVGLPLDPDLELDLDDDSEIVPSSAVNRFRRTTVAGAVLNGMALGLRDVFDPVVREEAPIVQDAAGEPDQPRHVDAHLDPDDPAGSSVVVRPWLSPPTT